MQIQVKPQKHSQVSITITVSDEELAVYESATLSELRTNARLPGFRPGKIPDAKLREHFGVEGLRAHVIEHALPELYKKAVDEQKLQPVSRPSTTISKLSPLTVEFTVDVFPTVSVKKVDKIKLAAKEVVVADAEVEEVLTDIRTRFRTFSSVSRPAAMGDRVEVSFTGEIDGKLHPRLASQHHPLILGSKSFLDGFEEQLVGASAGETRDVRAAFPHEHRAVELRGKEALFHVTIEQVEEVHLPELDDTLAATALGKDAATVAELRTDITDSIRRRKQLEEDDRLERELLEAVVKATVVDLPASFVDGEIEAMITELGERVEQQGLKLEHYLELQQTDMDGLRSRYREEAAKRVTARLAVNFLADEAKVEVTDEELDAALGAIEDGARAKDPRFRAQLRQNLRLTKALSDLRTNALRR